MIISRFTFTRGTEVFEVIVAEKWSPDLLKTVELHNKAASILLLETDDLQLGQDVFALDYFLMKQTGNLLEGEDLLKSLKINDSSLRHCLENEVRRLAARTREAFLLSRNIPAKSVMLTLGGIASALEYLGIKNPLTDDEKQNITSVKGAFSARSRSAAVLELLQKWEDLLEAKPRKS
jgi:hypothetical protein